MGKKDKKQAEVHYEMKTHENPVIFFMVNLQVLHGFFTGFSWQS